MTKIEAVVLGVVQGLTEFLPVSSSGHLVLFQHLFGLTQPELLFDICLHVGTLVAVLAVFSKDIVSFLTVIIRLPGLIRSTGGPAALLSKNGDARLIVMIVCGSFPTAALGIIFSKVAEQLFGTVWLVGIALFVTGALLWFTRRKNKEGRTVLSFGWRDALIIGLVQGLAIIPGISRSGATIATALYLGIDRELAGRFSFLLAIPAIVGALVLGLDAETFQSALPAELIFIGVFCSTLVGYVALRVLLHIVKQGRLYRFAPYCWIIGAIAVGLSIIR